MKLMNRIYRKKLRVVIWLGFCVTYVAAEFGWGIDIASAAQEDIANSTPILEEITVTARRREESLQDTPVAITALSSDQIERWVLNDIDQLSTQVPGLLAVAGGPSGAASIYVRGVGTGLLSVGFSSAVGVVIDGQYFSRARWIQPGMFDVQQVEVLKGPQALYWGKNNTAGLIIIQSKEPGDELAGYAKIGYEAEADETSVEGAISIPLSDTFAIRLAGRTTDMEGWMKNIAGPGVDPLGFELPGASYKDLPQENEHSGRLAVRWAPNDRFRAKLSVMTDHQTSAGVISTYQLIGCYGPNGTPQPALRVIPELYAECNLDFTTAQGGFSQDFLAQEGAKFLDAAGPRGSQRAEWDSIASSLQIDYQLENVTLWSVTGYQKFETTDIGAFTYDSSGSLPSYQYNDYESFSQEVRFITDLDQPVNFMGGVLYATDDYLYRVSSRVAIFPASSNGRRFSWERPSTQERETWSVFGEVTWDVSDDIEITAGARYTNEKLDAGMGLDYVHDIFHAIGYLNETPFDTSVTYTNVSPQATVAWHQTEDVTFYAAYKTGFKSGGFDSSNTLTASTTGDDLLFDEETAQGFELGEKALLFDNRLRLNGVIYRYEFKDLQVQTFDAATIVFLTRNAAKARTTGVEVDFEWAAAEYLSVHGSLNYNKAKYLDFITSCYVGQTQEEGCNIGSVNGGPANQTDLGGNELDFAPKWIATLGATYNHPLGSNWNGDISLDTRYSDDYSVGLFGLIRQDSYFSTDMSIRIRDNSDRWEFALIGRNLENDPILVLAGDRPLTGGGSGLPESDPLAGHRADTYGNIQRGRQLWVEATLKF